MLARECSLPRSLRDAQVREILGDRAEHAVELDRRLHVAKQRCRRAGNSRGAGRFPIGPVDPIGALPVPALTSAGKICASLDSIRALASSAACMAVRVEALQQVLDLVEDLTNQANQRASKVMNLPHSANRTRDDLVLRVEIMLVPWAFHGRVPSAV